MAPAGLRWVEEREEEADECGTPTIGVARRWAWPASLVGPLAWLVALFTYLVPTVTASVGLVALAALSWSAHRAGTPVDWLRIGSLIAAVAAMAMSGYITALMLG
jgi:hypothetical protein